jgi:arsenate reductase
MNSVLRGDAMSKPGVLFLCTGNSARSQMAEALLRKRAGDRFEVYSAGTEPKGINPLTIRVLNEIGLDISGQRCKGVKELLGQIPVRHLIVVCQDADRSCPTVWPGVLNRMFWPFDDPAAAQGSEQQRLEKFRSVRDQIDERIELWLDELDE